MAETSEQLPKRQWEPVTIKDFVPPTYGRLSVFKSGDTFNYHLQRRLTNSIVPLCDKCKSAISYVETGRECAAGCGCVYHLYCDSSNIMMINDIKYSICSRCDSKVEDQEELIELIMEQVNLCNEHQQRLQQRFQSDPLEYTK